MDELGDMTMDPVNEDFEDVDLDEGQANLHDRTDN